eukprot:GHVR01174268.1.p1 GENE.GHVR01174268.1~~GHVR01174268.1.p1  ORF type:complete len:177 (-),score=54.84 GHVR01174268.1:1-531(-)
MYGITGGVCDNTGGVCDDDGDMCRIRDDAIYDTHTQEQVNEDSDSVTDISPNMEDEDIISATVTDNYSNMVKKENTIVSVTEHNKTNYVVYGNTSESCEDEVHVYVRCNGCNMSPLMGKRYKCLLCYDFDLCDTCFSQKDSNVFKNTHKDLQKYSKIYKNTHRDTHTHFLRVKPRE